MKQIRKRVFETNSSSSHVLTLKSDNSCPVSYYNNGVSPIIKYFFEEGILFLRSIHFNNDNEKEYPTIFLTPIEKFIFLVGIISVKNQVDYDIWVDFPDSVNKELVRIAKGFNPLVTRIKIDPIYIYQDMYSGYINVNLDNFTATNRYGDEVSWEKIVLEDNYEILYGERGFINRW